MRDSVLWGPTMAHVRSVSMLEDCQLAEKRCRNEVDQIVTERRARNSKHRGIPLDLVGLSSKQNESLSGQTNLDLGTIFRRRRLMSERLWFTLLPKIALQCGALRGFSPSVSYSSTKRWSFRGPSAQITYFKGSWANLD